MESWVSLARSSPVHLGDFALGLRPAPIHREWHDKCDRYDRLILKAPVEHGKSTQLTVARVLWELGQNPDLRVAIISSTMGQSCKWLSKIKINITNNPRLRMVFPNLRRENRPGYQRAWYENAILVERSEAAALIEKDYSVQATGAMGNILGSRLDLVVMDDVLDFENTLSATQRQKVYDWFHSVLLGRLVEYGRLWIIGTAWHEDDTVHRLGREKPHIYHVAHYEAGVAPCLWPERWSPERLAKQRDILGEVEYNRQMRNIPLGAATGFFPVDHVKRCQELCVDPVGWWWGDYLPTDFLWMTAGVDLGGSSTGAPSAIAVAGTGAEDQHKHLVHLRSGFWIGGALLREMVDVNRQHHINEWMVESNATQLHIAAMLADKDILQAIGATPEEAANINVYAQFTTEYNKNHVKWGVRGLAPEFQGEKWRIPKDEMGEVEKLIGEMRAYTPEGHTGDRLIALWLANCRLQGAGIPLDTPARSMVIKRR